MKNQIKVTTTPSLLKKVNMMTLLPKVFSLVAVICVFSHYQSFAQGATSYLGNDGVPPLVDNTVEYILHSSTPVHPTILSNSQWSIEVLEGDGRYITENGFVSGGTTMHTDRTFPVQWRSPGRYRISCKEFNHGTGNDIDVSYEVEVCFDVIAPYPFQGDFLSDFNAVFDLTSFPANTTFKLFELSTSGCIGNEVGPGQLGTSGAQHGQARPANTDGFSVSPGKYVLEYFSPCSYQVPVNVSTSCGDVEPHVRQDEDGRNFPDCWKNNIFTGFQYRWDNDLNFIETEPRTINYTCREYRVIDVCLPDLAPSTNFGDIPVFGGCVDNSTTINLPAGIDPALHEIEWKAEWMESGVPKSSISNSSGSYTLLRRAYDQTLTLTVTNLAFDNCSATYPSSSHTSSTIASGTAYSDPVHTFTVSDGCDGEVITVNSDNTNTDNYTFAWSGAGTGSGTSTTVTLSASGPQTLYLAVTPKSASQCENVAIGGSDNNVPVGATRKSPTLAFTSTPTGEYCTNENISMTVTATGSDQLGTFTWYEGNVLDTSNPKGSGTTLGNTNTISLPAGGGPYWARAEDNGCTNNETFDTPTAFTPAPDPVRTPSIGITSLNDNSLTFCKKDAVNLSADLTSLDGVTSYTLSWTDNNGGNGVSAVDLTGQVLNEGANTFTLSLDPTKLCDVAPADATMEFTAYDPPTLTPIDDSFCEEDNTGAEVTGKTVSLGNLEAGMEYLLRHDADLTIIPMSSTSTTEVIFENVSEGIYTIYGNSASCLNMTDMSYNIESGSFTMEKISKPASGEISLINDDNGTACENQSSLVAPTGTGYIWSKWNGSSWEEQLLVNGGTYPLQSADVGIGQQFRVTYYINEQGCPFFYERDVTLDVNAELTPRIIISSDDENDKVCAGDDVIYTADLTDITNGTYTWTFEEVSAVDGLVIGTLPSETGSVNGATQLTTTQTLNESLRVKLEITGITSPLCLKQDQASDSWFTEVTQVVEQTQVLTLTYCQYFPGLEFEVGGADSEVDYKLFVENPQGSGTYVPVVTPVDEAINRDGTSVRFGIQLEGDYRIDGFSSKCGQLEADATTYQYILVRPSITPCLNYTTSSARDEDVEVARGRQFFDLTGDPIQSNSAIKTNNSELVSQSKYDNLDRAALQTLPALAPEPTLENGLLPLDYYLAFVTESDEVFRPDDWDIPAPNAIDNTLEGSLGYYYSENNTAETKVDASSYPYVKKDFYEDGSGEVMTSYGPGAPFMTNAALRTYSKTFPVTTELDGLYRSVRDALTATTSESLSGQLIKTVIRDAHNRESITYTDREGKVLVSAMGNTSETNEASPANPSKVPWTINFDATGMSITELDFHVPDGSSAAATTAINLTTGLAANGSQGQGFYRTSTDLGLSYSMTYYNPSFNFYDDRGRLLVSVPPLGAAGLIDGSVTNYDQIPFATYYKYDFQGRLLSMKEPDAGETFYIYRRDGSIRFSQNAEQRSHDRNRFSYTNYDRLGRPVESGEYWGGHDAFGTEGINFAVDAEKEELTNYLEMLDGDDEDFLGSVLDRKDFVRTNYDLPDATTSHRYEQLDIVEMSEYRPGQDYIEVTGRLRLTPGFHVASANGGRFHAKSVPMETIDNGIVQDFVQGAVSYTENKNTKTWYNYDEQGRVVSMSTWLKGVMEPKVVEYTYDLLGNVLDVAYQAGESDAFYHHYVYDADKRLSQVYASRSVIDPAILSISDLQAAYTYYAHGPLKEVDYGNGVESMEYVYNLQGQLKTINDPNNLDGHAFAQQYEYYSGDYTRVGVLTVGTADAPRYDGNIAGVLSSSELPSAAGISTLDYRYTYNDRSYLSSAYVPALDNYKVNELVYDANGNILTLDRMDEAGVLKDDLSYNYNTSNNQLDNIPGYGTWDYNQIGQMTESVVGGITLRPDYDVTGKVTSIKDETNALKYAYTYDDRGFRIRKEYPDNPLSENVFVRDASGQVMAIYKKVGDAYEQAEYPVYGASRIGNYMESVAKVHYELKDHLGNVRSIVEEGSTVTSTENYHFDGADSPEFTTAQALEVGGVVQLSSQLVYLNYPVVKGTKVVARVMGFEPDATTRGRFRVRFKETGVAGWTNRFYAIPGPVNTWHEVSLEIEAPADGDIQVMLEEIDGLNTASFDDLEVEVIERSEAHSIVYNADYYPFGSVMEPVGGTMGTPGRYGYQGDFSEQDPETGLNHFEARMYDPVIGRWNRVDPYRQFYSPYLAMANNPVVYVDDDGRWVNFAVGALAGFGAEVGSQIVTNLATGKEWHDIDWIDVGVSTAEGALTSGASVGRKILVKGAALGVRTALDYKSSEGFKAFTFTENLEISKSRANTGLDYVNEVIGAGVEAFTPINAKFAREASEIGIKTLSSIFKENLEGAFSDTAPDCQGCIILDEVIVTPDGN